MVVDCAGKKAANPEGCDGEVIASNAGRPFGARGGGGGDGALVYEAGYALVYIGKHSGAARELGIRRRNRDGTGARLGKKNEKDWMDGGGREYT